jgi:tetratricopeptide (TPR) repeat protein
MSLLLEALKKAEKAKEEAQRRARAEGGEAADAPVPGQAERKPVVTRDKLPDISTNLEIVTDDLAPPDASKPQPRPEPTLEPLDLPGSKPQPAAKAPPRAPTPKPSAAKTGDEQASAAGRSSAKKVFEAKFREPNPRMPFYITMTALGVFALGTVGYFWYQLRPPPALVNLNPPRQPEPAAIAGDARPTPVASLPANPPGAIPGLPATPSQAAAPAATGAAPTASPRAPVAAVETPRLPPSQRVADPRLAQAPAATTMAAPATRGAPQVNPRIEAGYSAYLAGDLVSARTAYEQVLREEPANRDALLGIGALDVRAGRYESAEALYLRVLQIDPRDSQAQAALFALRSGRSDPLATESRVKTLLAADPAAHALNFTLGNQLAQQNRWAEAQQEYFKAYSAEPDNADFVYNLAVSLDHLRQPRQALDYYQRAIGLAEKRGASFDLAAARSRVTQLGAAEPGR